MARPLHPATTCCCARVRRREAKEAGRGGGSKCSATQSPPRQRTWVSWMQRQRRSSSGSSSRSKCRGWPSVAQPAVVVERASARETSANRQSSIECSNEPVALRACMLLLLCEGLECEACERPIRDRAALLLAQQPASCACHMPLTRACACVPLLGWVCGPLHALPRAKSEERWRCAVCCGTGSERRCAG